MKADYIALGELRKIDEKVLRLSRELERIPLEIQKIDSTLDQRKQTYDKVKREVEDYEKKLRSTEQDLKEKEDFIKKAESKMMEVKTNEEYRAAMKENEGSATEKKKVEDQILVLMNGTEGERNRLKTAEGEFKEYENVASNEKKEYEQERDKLVKHFEEQLSKRVESSKKLSKEVGALYDRQSSRMKYNAIGIADNCLCLSCNMKMRAQLYNEILGLQAVHKCPSCNRVLIPQHIDAEVTTT